LTHLRPHLDEDDSLIAAILSGLMLASVVVCGLWIRFPANLSMIAASAST